MLSGEFYNHGLLLSLAHGVFVVPQIKKLDVGDKDKEGTEVDEEQLLSLDRRQVEFEIATLAETMQNMTPNMAAIEEYKRKEEQHNERLAELDQVTGQRDEARNRFDELRKERLDKFMAGFGVITNKLKEMYQVSLCVGLCSEDFRSK